MVEATSPPPTPVAVSSDAARLADDEVFHRLHKMSTTAGVGAGDYVAISGLAIASVLVGVASSTVLFGSRFLLLIPVVGVICAILAWVRIGQSNGTLTGRGLAVLGLLLSLGLGGYQGNKAVTAAIRAHSARGQIVQLIHDFGQDLAAERYRQAYDRCDAPFHQLVPPEAFEGTWRAAHNSKVLGTLSGIEWNGLLDFSVDATNGQPLAGGMVLVEFGSGAQSARTDMFFRQIDGRWMIDRIPQLFAPPQTSGASPVGPMRGGSGGPMGPPRPTRPPG